MSLSFGIVDGLSSITHNKSQSGHRALQGHIHAVKDATTVSSDMTE